MRVSWASLAGAAVADGFPHARAGAVLPLSRPLQRRLPRVPVLLLPSLLGAASPALSLDIDALNATLRAVVLTADPVPGMPGVTFREPRKSSIDNHGRIAFGSSLTGRGVTDRNDFALWLETSGTLTLVARHGARAPGYPGGVVFYGLNGLYLTDAEEVSLDANLSGGALGQDGGATAIFYGPPGNIDVVAGSLLPDPGGDADGLLSSAGSLRMHRQGWLAFTTFSAAGGAVVWAGRPGQLHRVAGSGDPAPGAEADTLLGGAAGTVVNSRGEVAFRSVIGGAGRRGPDDMGLWFGAPGKLRLVARHGDSAPGLEAGVTFEFFNDLRLNDAGSLIFGASTLRRGGQEPRRRAGLWLAAAGMMSLLVNEGAQAPGLAPGVLYGNVNGGGTMVLGGVEGQGVAAQGAGSYAWLHTLLSGTGIDTTNHTNDNAWWTWSPEGLFLLGQRGAPLPGLPKDWALREIFPGSFNRRGQLVFHAVLVEAGSPANERSAIFLLERPGGPPRLITRSGDTVEVRPGVVRTVAELFVRENLPDTALSMNDRGELVFDAAFTDGSHGVLALVAREGRQRPGDLTQDGRADLADVLRHLDVLFGDPGGYYPCRSGEANTLLLDVNGDGRVDLSDPVALALHLFVSGPPHAAGGDCRIVPDCPDVEACGQ